MPIRAKSVYDYPTYARFHRFHILRRSALGTAELVLIPLLVLVVVALLWSRPDLHEKLFWLYLPLFALLLALFLARVFLTPFIHFRSNKGLGNIVNEFEFGSDGFSVRSTSANVNGTATVRYEALYKVYETRDYIYLYQNRRQAFTVDKGKIEGGTAEELALLISGALPPGKYDVRTLLL